MPYCGNCGVEVAGRHCSNCGEAADNPSLSLETSTAEIERRPVSRAAVLDPVGKPAGYVPPMSGVPAPSMGSTATNEFTHDADFILRSTGERIAWQGKPSPSVLIPRIVFWTLVLAISIYWAASIHRGWGWVEIWAGAALLSVGAGWLRWRNTLYRITSQRLEYSGGLLSRVTAAVPLTDIGEVTIRRPLLSGLMGFGNLELDIADRTKPKKDGGHPALVLRGLRDLESIRDLIHSSSNFIGQVWDSRRFGR